MIYLFNFYFNFYFTKPEITFDSDLFFTLDRNSQQLILCKFNATLHTVSEREVRLSPREHTTTHNNRRPRFFGLQVALFTYCQRRRRSKHGRKTSEGPKGKSSRSGVKMKTWLCLFVCDFCQDVVAFMPSGELCLVKVGQLRSQCVWLPARREGRTEAAPPPG